MFSSAHAPDSDGSAARPRNRRLASTGLGTATSTSTSLLSSGNPSPTASRGVSPIPAAHIGRGTEDAARSAAGSGGFGKGIMEGSWAPSWASVQGFASSFLAGGGTYGSDTEVTATQRGRPGLKPLRRSRSGSSRQQPDTWGPRPPSKSGRPRLEDVAAGSLAQREAELRARRTASVLESHPGVNGGLDVAGRFKRRNSDEQPRDGGRAEEVEEHLVYIHHVQKIDTYAGIVLKYRCREDAFRKANGLWSRDDIQIRKWLALPVDACEIRGRPCDGPSFYSQDVDLLAPTPQSSHLSSNDGDDFFTSTNGKAAEPQKPPEEEARPWAHVRWVSMDNFAAPVEIARVSRKVLGYFPPRRKKSLHTTSTLSTPRHSLDVPSVTLSDSQLESPGSTASKRHSTLAGRAQVATAYGLPSSASPSRSRVGSSSDAARPRWMRGPGGVGSLGKHVRAPGPEKDYLNVWTQKHLPGLNMESLPSMSVMGSETAHFGFGAPADAAGAGAAPGLGLVESPSAAGRDAADARGRGTGLDKAAAAVETWLRGAFAKRPGTPVVGPLLGRRPQDDGLGDLIELEDANSDDGRSAAGGLLGAPGGGGGSSLLSANPYRSSGRSEGEGAVRGRSLPSSSLSKGKKAD